MGAASQKIRGQLVLPEVLGTRGALGYRVVEAVLEEQCALFLAEAARSSAVKMHDLVAVKSDGVVHQYPLLAPRALRRSHFVPGVSPIRIAGTGVHMPCFVSRVLPKRGRPAESGLSHHQPGGGASED